MTVKLIKQACRGIKRQPWGVVTCLDDKRCSAKGCLWVRFHKLADGHALRRETKS